MTVPYPGCSLRECGDTRPLKATDTIRHVTSGPMAFAMEDPNFFHAACLPIDCDVDQFLNEP
jgi:hypothetical protein